MASLFDSPLEIIADIIDALQDDIASLRACSQTCQLLFPICRKYIFQTIDLTYRESASLQSLSNKVASFIHLIDSDPGIADYVQNLLFQFDGTFDEDEGVFRALERLHRVRSLTLIGTHSHPWHKLRQSFREMLLRLIHLPLITRLEIGYMQFPITAFLPCVNLTSLTLTAVSIPVVESAYQEKYSAPGTVPQLQSFTFSFNGAGYAKLLFDARRSNGAPLLNFSNLQVLNVYVNGDSDLGTVHTLLRGTRNLQTLGYVVRSPTVTTRGYTGLASSLNRSSLSTLKQLRFSFDIYDAFQDPLCGICEELSLLAGLNVVEEITLGALVQTDCQCKTGSEWGRLDAVLTNGFPMLRRVSLHIEIAIFSSYATEAVLLVQAKLNKVPSEYFPWLSKNTAVTFCFSTEVVLV